MRIGHIAVGLALAGCGFHLGAQPGDGGPSDTDADPDAAIDAPADAAIDAPPSGDPCLGNWCRRMALTIQPSKVTAGPHMKFPILVDFASDANLAVHARTDGFDLLFTAANGTTKLDFERVAFAKANGRLLAWVEIPSLSSTADTVIYLYYGNATATDQQNVAGTWEAAFKGVWHLEQSAGMLADSSTFNNAGVAQNGLTLAAGGKIGAAAQFDGTDDRLMMADSASLDSMSASATFELWINWANPASGAPQLVMCSSNNFVAPKSSFEWATQADGDHFIYPRRGDGDNAYNLATTPFTSGAWHHLAVTLQHSTKQALIYRDGAALPYAVNNVPTIWMAMATPGDWLWGGHPA